MRGAGDDRIMSRHLAGDQPSTFRGVTSVSSEHSDGPGAGGNLLEGGGSNLHPSRMPMGNLAPTLRRSMPAVNAQQQQQNWGGTSQAQHKTASRHMSFSIDQQQQEEGEREKRRQLATNADEGEGPEEASARQRTAAAKDEQGRSTSAHSYSSLSPSGSLVFTSAGPNFSPNRVMELGAAAMVQSSSRVLDTRQIQVFLKKREDSRATISTTLSDMTDFTSQSSQLQQRTTPAEVNSNSNNTNAVPPPQPAQTGNNTANSSVPLKHTRKVFHSSDTRSSIFSVSSSVDSAKEERIISNLEHTSAANNRVVVLPRPHPLLPSQQQHSLQVDHGSTGFEGDGGGSDADNSEERTRSSSAEHQRVSPIEGLNDNGRRPSVDSTTTKVVTAGGGSSPPSSWHSISELNSARHSDGGGGSEKRRPSTQILADRLDDSSSGKAEIWHSPPPPRPQSQASNRRSNYLGELVWQVDETVYCGGIEAAQNQNLLCRLNIEYIVDLSGQEDDPTLANSRPRTEYPCLCPKRTAHSRMTMSIRIKDDSHQQLLSRDSRPPIVDAKAQTMEREEIIHYFEALIDLIRKARISQKKVLIHSLKGRNRAPAFVAAYLMHCNRVTRVQAINKISKMMSSIRPGICISDTLQRALMRWQSILGIRAESSRLDSQQLNKMFAVKRTAWN